MTESSFETYVLYRDVVNRRFKARIWFQAGQWNAKYA